MDTKIVNKGKCCIISCIGDTSDFEPGPWPEILKALQKGEQQIILDFKELTFLNSTGINALKESAGMVKSGNARIGISEPNPQVRQIIMMNGVCPDIPVYYNEKEAMKWLDMHDYKPAMVKNISAHTLLICQKNIPLAGLLRKALKDGPARGHFRMIPCRDLDSAIGTIMKERVDCIIIEAGFSLIKVTDFIEKASTDRRLPAIPILVVTNDELLMSAYSMVRNGAHEILRYPFREIEVLIRLQNLICYVKEYMPLEAPKNLFITSHHNL
jgi:anti-anti-sigma factor